MRLSRSRSWAKPAMRRSKNFARWRNGKGAVCYTAYNHRFEPHYRAHARSHRRPARSAASIPLPHVLWQRHGAARARFGMARPGRRRAARPRLASPRHRALLVRRSSATISVVLAPRASKTARPITSCFGSSGSPLAAEFEMTLLSWRNHFTCDVFAENGSAHIQSLCKWGPSDLHACAVASCQAAARPKTR